MRRFLSKLFFFSFVIVAFGYCLGLLATEVSPSIFWPLAFFGLTFPFFFFVLLFFTFYWLISKNKKGIAPIALLVLGYLVQPSFYALSVFQNKKSQEAITVISYNVRNFNLYNNRTGDDRDEIIDFLKEQQPDILCIQEAYRAPSFLNFDDLQLELEMHGYHFEPGVQLSNKRDFGILTLSKYPIIERERINFNAKGNLAMRTDLLINSDTVSVYNVHLASVHFSPEDYEYLEQIKEGENKKEDVGKAKPIIVKLKNGFVKRSKQANQLKDEINKSNHSMIVCGDFNDTSMSYAYSSIKGNLNDTFTKGNFGVGRTYVGIPFLRIDHILASNSFQVLDHDIHRKAISDHYPVVVQLKKK